MFLITRGWEKGGGEGAARPSQVEVTEAGICTNQLSIGRGSRCCVQENKRERGAEQAGCCVQLHFKKEGGKRGQKKWRVPN